MTLFRSLNSCKKKIGLLQPKVLDPPWQNIRLFSELPSQAQVVICGAGVVGNSIAYHLTLRGWTDVVVVDKARVGEGTSYEGSGVLGLFKSSSERHIVSHSVQLIKRLQAEGHDLGFTMCGSLNLARTQNRAIALKRRMAYTKAIGLESEWLDRHEIRKRNPYIYTADLEGGVWVPADAVASPRKVCSVLAFLAQEGGAKYLENCEVLQVLSDFGTNQEIVPKVTSVLTTKGQIKCEYFVNAASMWSRGIGENSYPKVRVPTYPAEHFYLHTVKMPGATDSMPIIRDFDSHTFCLARKERFIIGGFEHNAKPAFEKGIPKEWRGTLVADQKHFEPIKMAAEHRMPILKDATYEKLVNAPDNFTPDGKWVVGETPEIDNYFVAVGMNGNSLQGAGGVGQSIAEWMIHGNPSTQMLPFDVRRFVDLHNNRRYLKERTREVVGRHYDIIFPAQGEYRLARKLRCSPIHSEQEARGAVFGSRMGFERPLYYDNTHKIGDPPAQLSPGSFRKPAFLDSVRDEYQACKEGVGLIDLSSFTKIEITTSVDKTVFRSKSAGNQVVEYMQKLCSNDVNVPIGGVVHTGMQNDRGGYENDCLLIRTAHNSYLMLAPTIQQTRVMDWMKRQITSDTSVSISDLTSMYSVFSVVGPKSRDMLSVMSNTDLVFFGHTAKRINLGYASGVLILSFTHMGEPGYTLLIPSEYTLNIFHQLMKVGHDYGIKNVGMHAMRCLRVEKFIPFWAEELSSTVTPYEVGRGYKVKLNKDYFIGKFALNRQCSRGVKKRLVYFIMGEDFDAEKDIWPWGTEPIYRNGNYIGNVTSTAYSFALEKVVCLGFIRHHQKDFVSPSYLTGANFLINIAGQKYSAKASLQAPSSAPIRQPSKPYKPRVRIITSS